MEQLRAVIYNRCSTEEESQKDALVKQVKESKNCVCELGWRLVDTYVEAKSGTTVKGRSEYGRLYQDLEQDKFDIIVIKSQDRLMRNTKDWYLFLDRMQRNRKKLYMYLEGKFYTPDDALITGIKAILAEEYSRELSKKINNAHKNRQKEGKSFVFTNRMYGLKKLPDKSIVIDEREAEMIRMIFRLSADGYGTHSSAEILYEKGYRNRNGKMLSPSMIRNLIRNPVYKGTVVQNKRHYEFERKQTVRNPEEEWIVHRDAVPAIVDSRLFEAANRALDHRKRTGQQNNGAVVRYGTGSHELSGKIICGLCGEPFYRTVRRNKSGKIAEWKCSNYLHHGRRADELRRNQIRKTVSDKDAGCDNVHLDEKKLLLCLEQICGPKLKQPDRKEILEETMTLLGKVFGDSAVWERQRLLEAELQKARYRKELLLEKLLDGVIDDQDYQWKNRDIQEKIESCKERIRQLGADPGQKEARAKRLEDIKEHLVQDVIGQALRGGIISEIDRIMVYPAQMEICFRIRKQPDRAYTERGTTDHAACGDNDGTETVIIAQSCSTSHGAEIEEQKKRMLDLVRTTPGITAKEIAEEMGVTLSLTRRRMQDLRAERKIDYRMRDGRGQWIIVEDRNEIVTEECSAEDFLDFSD